jgi:hypothetical protein
MIGLIRQDIQRALSFCRVVVDGLKGRLPC